MNMEEKKNSLSEKRSKTHRRRRKHDEMEEEEEEEIQNSNADTKPKRRRPEMNDDINDVTMTENAETVSNQSNDSQIRESHSAFTSEQHSQMYTRGNNLEILASNDVSNISLYLEHSPSLSRIGHPKIARYKYVEKVSCQQLSPSNQHSTSSSSSIVQQRMNDSDHATCEEKKSKPETNNGNSLPCEKVNYPSANQPDRNIGSNISAKSIFIVILLLVILFLLNDIILLPAIRKQKGVNENNYINMKEIKEKMEHFVKETVAKEMGNIIHNQQVSNDINTIHNSINTEMDKFTNRWRDREKEIAEIKESYNLLKTNVDRLSTDMVEAIKLAQAISNLENKLMSIERNIENQPKLNAYETILKEEVQKVSAELRDLINQKVQEHISNLQLSMENNLISEKSISNGFDIQNNKELTTLISRIVEEALEVYSADKIKKVDYALRSIGSEIVDHSPSYNWMKYNWKSFPHGFDKFLFHKNNPPETILDPNVSLGNCWAFQGQDGFVIIKVPYKIVPESFSIEHVPLSVTPDISSAPKNISVFGYLNNKHAPELIASYVYDINKSMLQSFPVNSTAINVTVTNNEGGETMTKSYQYFVLKVYSNYGNKDYTCIYRFRIHGTRVVVGGE
jgi:hypothetical protein